MTEMMGPGHQIDPNSWPQDNNPSAHTSFLCPEALAQHCVECATKSQVINGTVVLHP